MIEETLRGYDAAIAELAELAETTHHASARLGGHQDTPRRERFLATLPNDRSYVVAAVEAFAQAERSDELRRDLADAYSTFRAQVADNLLHAAGGGEDDDLAAEARAAASVLIALFDGLAVQWLLDPAAAPDAKAVVLALGLIGKSISGAGVGGPSPTSAAPPTPARK